MIIILVFLFISASKSSQFFKDIERCTVTEIGEEYIGSKSVTKSGKKCLMWKDVLKYHKETIDTYFAGRDINLAYNYCRNPNAHSSGPWCYFGCKIEEWEICDIPSCEKVGDCKDTTSGEEYDGFINITKEGKTCQNWSFQSPHAHRFKERDFPENDFNKILNKCRNPDKESNTWCYTTDPNQRFDYCDVPMCEYDLSETEYFKGKDNIRTLGRYAIQNIMKSLIYNVSVVVSIPKKYWSDEVEQKIAVWGTEYSSTCQRNLNYYEFCQRNIINKNEEKVKLTFICKKPLLSFITVIPLRKEQFSAEWIKGPEYIINNELNKEIKDYIKKVNRDHKGENYTASIRGNAGPFFLLSDNVIPYAVTKDNKIVMTISYIGKGRIGFIGGDYFTQVQYESKLGDLFEKVYGNSQIKPDHLNKSYISILTEKWKTKRIIKASFIWDAHEELGKDNIDLLIKMINDGLNIIVGIKPWAYFYYTSKFKHSEIMELLLLAGVWPSTEIVYGDLRIIKEVDLKFLPLIHLFEYAKSNLTSAVTASSLIHETLSNIPYYELTEYPEIVRLLSKIRSKLAELYQAYNSVVKSYIPCLQYPANTNDRLRILNMYDSILLNPLDNYFTVPGINFYPGTINLKEISLEIVEIKLKLTFKDENTFFGVMAPSSKTVTVFIHSKKSKVCTIFVNYHLFDVSNWDRWDKWPRTSKNYIIKTNTTRTFINSFGGLLSISCDTNDDQVVLKISNVVRVPIYDRRNKLLGNTWSDLKKRNVPWAILAADTIVFIVPIIAIRNMENPQSILETWDKMIKEEFHLRGRSVSGTSRELLSADFQIKAGYMHAGYPIGTFIQHVANPAIRRKYLFAEEAIRKEAYWGVTHEVGHNLQHNLFTFSGTVDVTNNVFTLIATETMTGKNSWNQTDGWVTEGNLPYLIDYINKRKFSLWQSSPFIGLGTYAQLRAEFGWEFYRQIFRRYDQLIIEYNKGSSTMTDEERIQLWIIESSNIVRMNLVPFYDFWAWPITDKTKKQLLDKYPSFLPDDFLTKLTADKVNEIITNYGGIKVVLRKPLIIPIIVGPLKDALSIEGYPTVEEIIVI